MKFQNLPSYSRLLGLFMCIVAIFGGAQIVHAVNPKITHQTVTKNTVINCDYQTISNPSAFVGENEIIQPCINGNRSSVYDETLKNGKVVNEKLVSTKILQPTQAQITKVGTLVKPLEYVQVKTYPIGPPGTTATITASTLAGSTCSIIVNYKSGQSHAAGLYPKTAGTDGSIAWSWYIGTNTTPGTWPINITCSIDGQNASTTSKVEVTGATAAGGTDFCDIYDCTPPDPCDIYDCSPSPY